MNASATDRAHPVFSMNPVIVDTFIASRGAVHVGRGAALVAARKGDRLRAGTRLRTGSTGFALLVIGSTGVRVGPWTVVELTRAGHVKLERGRLYVDSGALEREAGSLVIDSVHGRVTHGRARYQLRLDPMALSVDVRDGCVWIERGAAPRQSLERGEGVDLFKNGAARRVAVAPCGARWAWTCTLVPELAIHGRPLSAFLDWYSAQTGLSVTLGDQVTRELLDRTLLYGNIKGLAPADALAVVAHMTQLDFTVHRTGELTIERREMAETGT